MTRDSRPATPAAWVRYADRCPVVAGLDHAQERDACPPKPTGRYDLGNCRDALLTNRIGQVLTLDVMTTSKGNDDSIWSWGTPDAHGRLRWLVLPPEGRARTANSYLVFPKYQHFGWVSEHGGSPRNPLPVGRDRRRHPPLWPLPAPPHCARCPGRRCLEHLKHPHWACVCVHRRCRRRCRRARPCQAYKNAKAELGYKHPPGSNPTKGGSGPVADHVGEVVMIPGQRLKIVNVTKESRDGGKTVRYWTVHCRQLLERG